MSFLVSIPLAEGGPIKTIRVMLLWSFVQYRGHDLSPQRLRPYLFYCFTPKCHDNLYKSTFFSLHPCYVYVISLRRYYSDNWQIYLFNKVGFSRSYLKVLRISYHLEIWFFQCCVPIRLVIFRASSTRYLERIKYTRRRIINKIRSYTILILIDFIFN